MTVAKSSIAAIKSMNPEEIEILKAKRRNEGETWTQPSGRKVTKKNGKIVPVSNLQNRTKVGEQPKRPTNQKQPKNSNRFSDDDNSAYRFLHSMQEIPKGIASIIKV